MPAALRRRHRHPAARRSRSRSFAPGDTFLTGTPIPVNSPGPPRVPRPATGVTVMLGGLGHRTRGSMRKETVMWSCQHGDGADIEGDQEALVGPGRRPFGIAVVGGPTAVIDIAGTRIVTDPTFDPPTDYG